MNPISKLMLSVEEQELVNNAQWILTKRTVIDKVYSLLGHVAESQQAIIEKEKEWMPPAVVRSSPKIAKGENYLQLPYVLLDYPRCFDAENVFAVRTMFWWANFFSITLHLSGNYKQLFCGNISAYLDRAQHEFFICINENQWHHHFEADNYKDVKVMTVPERHEAIAKNQFIKLAVKFPLQQWNDMPVLLEGSFKEIIEMLKG